MSAFTKARKTLNWWKAMTGKTLVLCAMVSVSVVRLEVSSRQVGDGAVMTLVALAKKQGRTFTKRDTVVALDVVTDPEAYLDGYSALVAEMPRRLSVVTTHTKNDIYTWQSVRSVKWVRRDPVTDSPECPPRPSKNIAGRQMFPIAILGGRATVDGVVVEMTSNVDVDLEGGRRYLFLGTRCSNETLAVGFARRNTLLVESGNRLVALDRGDSFAGWLESFTTLERFERFLKERLRR